MKEVLYLALEPLKRQIALTGDPSLDQARPGELASSIHLLHCFMEWLKHAIEERVSSQPGAKPPQALSVLITSACGGWELTQNCQDIS